jgi:hypothetical protein
MDLKETTGQLTERSTSESERSDSFIREWWWVGVTMIVVAGVVWLGLSLLRGGVRGTTPPVALPTATTIAAGSPVRLGSTVTAVAGLAPVAPAPTAAAVAGSGGSNGQPTPTDDQRAAAYLNQLSTEQDYCFCNRTSSSVLLLTPDPTP